MRWNIHEIYHSEEFARVKETFYEQHHDRPQKPHHMTSMHSSALPEMGGPRSLLFGPTLFYNKNVFCATNLVLWWNFVGGKKGLVWLHGITFGIDGLAAPLLVVLHSTAAPMSSWSTKCLVQCLVLVKTSKEIPLITGTQEENLLTPRLAPHVHDATAHKPFFGQETKSVTQKKNKRMKTQGT